jgi:hypothetical protein
LAAVTPAAAALTSACTASSQQEPDPLEAVAASARSDAGLAQAIARTHPDVANQARAVAAARQEHALALQREVDRLNPPDPDAPRPATPPPTRVPSSSQATTTLAEVLRRAQTQAGGMVPTAPGYRAGLLGSVSASCASLVEVLA